jgi:hypothetical protein
MNMASDSVRRWLIGGALVATAGCATSEDFSAWREHHTHFASAQHMQFSLRNIQDQSPQVTPEDTAAAEAESWWGQPVPAAYTADIASQADNASRADILSRADIAGRWTGTWSSDGSRGVARGSIAVATFTQHAGFGQGTLMFADAIADQNVPYSLRWAGSFGIPVVLRVVGSDVSLEALSVGQPFVATLKAEGDQIVGRIGSAQIHLTRAR